MVTLLFFQFKKMARIKTSAIISDIRGKLAGSVFQGTKSGLVLKNISFNPIKASDKRNKSLITAQHVHNAWRTLTVLQRNIWQSFADYAKAIQKNDKSKILSGNELFFKVNFIRLVYNHAILISPEFSKCNFFNYTATVYLSSSQLFFETSRTMLPLNEFIVLKMSNPLLPSVNSASSKLRIIPIQTAAQTIFDITALYLSVFYRMPVSGNALFFSYTNCNLKTGLSPKSLTQKIII